MSARTVVGTLGVLAVVSFVAGMLVYTITLEVKAARAAQEAAAAAAAAK